MTKMENLYRYLQKNYRENVPIFLSDLSVPNMKPTVVRQLLKKLVDDGKVKRFDQGIYFIPRKTFFQSESMISIDDVIKKKYLIEGTESCGYLGGLLFANRVGVTSQVPMIYEVITNKATTDYRESQLANFRIIIKKPYAKVNTENVNVLQFLDLIKEITEVSELQGNELQKKLMSYMRIQKIDFNSLKPYLSYFPDRIYKNLYEVGLLNGVSTS